ncbi:probable alpha-galactosidase [Oscarella lobularis]|uniref:probable alpha-galactosidase n=1 Tax=Oscarella lobularis TaxID=121494 RepID=UPI003313BAE9
MNRRFLALALLAKVLLFASGAQTGSMIAQTPPMGWSSWNHFTCAGINETVVKGVADAMVSSGLKDFGYIYVNLDDCWQINRTADGVIVPDPTKFPNGIPSLVNYVKAKGLKFGLYTSRGVMTCQRRPGSYGYEEIDAKTYASWGVEFLKNDNCYPAPHSDPNTDYGKMSLYLNATGKQFVHSVQTPEPIEIAYNVSNMRRVGHDIQDHYDSMLSLVQEARQQGLAKYAHPGFWNDLDMMEIGNGHMTTIEYITHMSLWCLLKAPLIMGNDVRNIDKETLTILTNKEVLAVNQDALGVQGTLRANRSVVISTNALVAAQSCVSGSQYQTWKFNVSSGAILNVETGACLSAPTSNLVQVSVQPCDSGNPAQKWAFGDHNKIHPAQDKLRCLDVYMYSGPPIQLANCKNTSFQNQQFAFESDGTFRPNVSKLCVGLQPVAQAEVWGGPLSDNAFAAVLLNKDAKPRNITVQWSDLNFSSSASYSVRDLWQRKDMGTFTQNYTALDVPVHGVAMIKLTPS